MQQSFKNKTLYNIALIIVLLTMVNTTAFADQPAPTIGEPVVLTNAAISPQMVGCSRLDFASLRPDYEQRVVELVNDERAKVSAPPLKRNTDLDFASRYHSKDMTEDDYFGHDTYDRSGGNLVFTCAWNTRIGKFYPSPGGENAAAGYGSPAEVMSAWMSSGGHKANILNTSWREIGVGYYNGGGTYYTYWIQDFGTRSSVYPLVINREYATTSNPDVNLYIYGQGVFTQMRLKNDDEAWTAWESFQSQRSWRLPWRKGIHRVTAELKKADGSIITSYDEIDLTTGAILGNLPDSIRYVYDRSTGKLYPSPLTLSPKNTGSDDVIEWTLQAASSWVLLSSTSGATPNGQTTIQPDSSKYQSPGTFECNITFQDKATLQAEGSPKVIPVTLVVVNSLSHKIFLPAVQRTP
jgi:uncharacterized protein YkwD